MSILRHLPSFHVRPSVRLEKPIITTNKIFNSPSAPLNKYRFHPVSLRLIRSTHELVYDPVTSLRSHGPCFSADFESGNLGQVFKIGPRTYEIHLLPDPTRQYSALWYFFKVTNLTPGEYIFHIVGFFRDEHQHDIGVLPTAYSENQAARNGLGWFRIGQKLNFWRAKNSPTNSNFSMNSNSGTEFALSFHFSVEETDTMYFSYLYPYTYSEMMFHLNRLRRPFNYSILCSSSGGVDVPVLLWDAEVQRCVNINACTIKPVRTAMRSSSNYIKKKPLIIIASRLHPGESNSSFAMEGFMNRLFSHHSESVRLRKHFSFLLLPMVNPDGVICGYYRPTIHGDDANRVWKKPDKILHPIAYSFIKLLDILTQTKPPIFILDFHGHTAQCNAFTYGVDNPHVFMNNSQKLFPKIMSELCPIFDEPASISFKPNDFPTTMRVALHHRYKIPFAYTLEMSFGALSIGPDKNTQITPSQYRQVGQAVSDSLAVLLLDSLPTQSFVKNYIPIIPD
ncbi:Clan MC, family M14, Zinc carboxypeptidase-like metallopeptidase [Tritrichomonas foetus]|uniref:Clan MC, family M14, Zinc carboxypeptidase-like metallopeptidase n=1 Tax=Tritrichomonas foetus TaxID=1144522 RepID=A0A1J4J9X3_9EUKA|nr:Clan MC, family M14, Zinc carboxypeptidase-like metallopeptidase [Tritrichomonas foetus]|eukprot:OHS94052.1 Clan MC, family M14, Zinc carboxypeptidase-like metallopeptidase [Tritrichomonas foetus]